MAELIPDATLDEWEAHPALLSDEEVSALIAAYRESRQNQLDTERAYMAVVQWRDKFQADAEAEIAGLRADLADSIQRHEHTQRCWEEECRDLKASNEALRRSLAALRAGIEALDWVYMKGAEWHEGYGAGSSDATDGWLHPGSPRTPNPRTTPTPPAGGDA